MDPFTRERAGTGVDEWAKHRYNIGRGCSHNCAYCYARADAVDRWKRIRPEDWTTERINQAAVDKRWYSKADDVIMFPTTHDITSIYLESAVIALSRMLAAGNDVLIVSKPHLDCIERLCAELTDYRRQILFRFTIGSMDADTCALWEPGAPPPEERIKSLLFARAAGFNTSVSIEPNLGGVLNAVSVVEAVDIYVTHDIWIGKMNKIDQRVKEQSPELAEAIARLKVAQNDTNTMLLYHCLRQNPKVAWKDSIREVVARCSVPQ
ncbi:radical SAM protein [Anaeroselena agilis]|uniref:Radical SAM protein n=1 Tax=Anaeroselena agilis TaxID=3063788 RepID=A0ABU3P1B1_9FIRM|nr:radical SAM protein [Selenomonadales bacterium 4137-cl]MDT8901866.1 radical SAM protein [Selenomonadales bacterium 4137-cl]